MKERNKRSFPWRSTQQIMAFNSSHGVRMNNNFRDSSDAFLVRHLFVFIKENLLFDYLKKEFIRRNLFPDENSKRYVLSATGQYYRSERFLKLLINKQRCKEFIACMHDMSCHKHIYNKIRMFRNFEGSSAWKVVEKKPSFLVNDKMLNEHFEFLFTWLEPREIADEMFQAGLFSTEDHDYVTENPKRRKRLLNLFEILEDKRMHARFLVLLEKMQHTQVLETLKTNRQLREEPCDSLKCVRHNFTFLQGKLLEIDEATDMNLKELTESDLSDIKSCDGIIRKISKLLKIILMKGEDSCREFLKALNLYIKSENLIPEMIRRSTDITKRGRPNLFPNLKSLTKVCLLENKMFLKEELEPITITDLLFEESALNFSDHDKITETKYRRKQAKHLLETLQKNNDKCFHCFLDILQREKKYHIICKELGNPIRACVGNDMFYKTNNSYKHEIIRKSGVVENVPIDIKMSVTGHEQIEQRLIDSCIVDMSETTISVGQMDSLRVTEGSVIIQLRPVTDDAVQTLLDAKENNRLFEMILGILKKVDIVKSLDNERPLQIRVQVFTSKLQATETNTGNIGTSLIKQRLRMYKKQLLDELEPAAIVYELRKADASLKVKLDSVGGARSCGERIHRLLTIVEEGSPDLVKEFMHTLNVLGYTEIVNLIDPKGVHNKSIFDDPKNVHNKAEDIRKAIVSNYKIILDEMQTPLATETLSKCVGDVNDTREKIHEGCKSRRERMGNFLRFILHYDHNVIEFEKVLRGNGLAELLSCEESVQRKDISVGGIALKFVDDFFQLPSEGVLFDSIITLAFGDMVEKTDAWTENVNFQELSILFNSFNIVIREDPSQMSFIEKFLEASNLNELVEEIRFLANRIVLCKHIKDKDQKNGTVYVYRVVVKNIEKETIIEETDRREELDFFHRKNENLIKVILIGGDSSDVTETKRTVKKKYEKFFQFQTIHLHHENEHYAEVARLIAHKKIAPFLQYVMSVRNSIPLNRIEDIVRNAVERALSKDSITRLCFEAVINESGGDISSGPYVCRSIYTVKRLKKELVQKTLESVSKYLGEDICKEMQRHIVSDLESKFNIDVNPFIKFLKMSALILLQSVLTMIAAIMNPFAGMIVGIVSAVGTVIITVNVNSEDWRRDVASEIYENINKNKQNLIRDVTLNIKERCRITIYQLEDIVKQLETFQRRIDYLSLRI